mmetsp:Transcript_3256/g.10917  ORF Transcript_3256/g.10917 Transcript_3256/m.10917 type:complete len:227 (+) Transcript_3256:1495-2175(+)
MQCSISHFLARPLRSDALACTTGTKSSFMAASSASDASRTRASSGATASRRTRPRQRSFSNINRAGMFSSVGGRSRPSMTKDMSSSSTPSSSSSLSLLSSGAYAPRASSSSRRRDAGVDVAPSSASSDTTERIISHVFAHTLAKSSASMACPSFNDVGFINNSPARRMSPCSCVSRSWTPRVMEATSAKNVCDASRWDINFATLLGGNTSSCGMPTVARAKSTEAS